MNKKNSDFEADGYKFSFGENIERIADALVRIVATLENIDDAYQNQYNDALQEKEVKIDE